MTAAATKFEEDRRWPRHEVKWEAVCDVGNQSLITGQVLDHGHGGVFFYPENSYVDGEFLMNEDVLNLIDQNENVTIFVLDGKGNRGIRLNSKVVWSGKSANHECYGFGVEFNSAN